MKNWPFLLLSIAFIGCTNEKSTDENNVKTIDSELNVKSDSVAVAETLCKADTLKIFEGLSDDILKGAEFKKSVLKACTAYFSNNQLKDTFKLFIPKGMVNRTYSNVSIINSKGTTIYSLYFSTYFLRDGYEILEDCIGENLTGQDEMLSIENTLTKEDYEKYLSKKANEFLVDPVFTVDHHDRIFDDQYSLKKDLRDELIKDQKIKLVSFPIYYADEGTMFIGYSKKKKQAFVFAESD